MLTKCTETTGTGFMEFAQIFSWRGSEMLYLCLRRTLMVLPACDVELAQHTEGRIRVPSRSYVMFCGFSVCSLWIVSKLLRYILVSSVHCFNLVWNALKHCCYLDVIRNVNYQRRSITYSGITNIIFCTNTRSVCLIGVFYDCAFIVIYKNSRCARYDVVAKRSLFDWWKKNESEIFGLREID